MPRVIETSVCAHCDRTIEHHDWGAGGTQWVHVDTGKPVCWRPTYAQPVLD